MFKEIHSLLAFVLLSLLMASIISSLMSASSNKPFEEKHKKLALYTLIAAHSQMLIGFLLYFLESGYFKMLLDNAKEVMQDSHLRLMAVEHPFTNILAIVFITIGFSQHKKQTESKSKFLKIAIFYGLGLIMLLSRIPWNQWMGS